jgi:para-nitrobenzyl esterase
MFFRLRWIGLLIASALAILFITNYPVLAEQRTVVRVEAGTLQGVAENQIVRFQGVPYAAPPVGALRWAAPQSAQSWSGIREATALRFHLLTNSSPLHRS